MVKKIQYGIAILGLPLYLITMTAHASYTNCRSSAAPAAGIAAPLCGISFTGTLPTFACASGGTTPPILGTYTVTNNTPVTMTLGTPILINKDGLPDSDAVISANTCGSTLASGASCLITVEITVNTTLDRILEIPVNSRQVVLDSSVITPTGSCTITPPTPPSPTLPCALGTTSSFGVLAGSAITNTGSTVINGNLGLTPGSSVTGFPPGTVTGTQYIDDATAVTAQNDLTTLYNCLAAQPCGTVIGTTDQAGVTLNSSGTGAVNVYCSGSTINVSGGTLTLNGDATSVFIFQAGSALNITNANIALTGGLTAANVFWQVTSSASLTPGAGTEIFYGTIAALTSITMSSGGSSPSVAMDGRALARNGAVTFNDDTVTVP